MWATKKKERENYKMNNEEIICLSATVNQAEDWHKALKEACPETSKYTNVWDIGGLYPPTSQKTEKVDFLLCKFPEPEYKYGITWYRAIACGNERGLKKTNPREMFAVVREHNLLELLKVNVLSLMATEECLFMEKLLVVYALLNISEKTANLGYLGDAHEWSLFRR